MFYLSEIEHTLRLPPHLLNLPLNEAIKGELKGLFVDKVIAKLGLCISVYDIRSIDGGFIFPGDGASTYTVKFRLIIFRPFVGEVIAARLKESNANGLRLSLGFFDDIYIPAVLMPNPSHSEPDPDSKNQVRWIWEYNGEKYPIDGVDEIRFRVHNISYPPIPLNQDKDSRPFAPMVITGSLDADGLGPISCRPSDMGNLFLDKIKKQASYFLHEKYKTARLYLTDATQAELLAEDATNNDVCNPDNITMTMIAEASYEVEDYWKIVDVLHKRFDEIDWIQWRQSYKSLVLLEFLIIHGPEDLAAEFLSDLEIIRELGSFKYKDERGFDWGLMMQRKSERILHLLQDNDALKQARLRAQRISSEIHGFGSSMTPSPSSASSSSSFGSNSTTSSSLSDTEEPNKDYENYAEINTANSVSPMVNRDERSPWSHCYNRKEKETLLINVEDEEEAEKDANFVTTLCSRLGISPRGRQLRNNSFKRLPDVKEKRIFRQVSTRG